MIIITGKCSKRDLIAFVLARRINEKIFFRKTQTLSCKNIYKIIIYLISANKISP